MPDVSFYLLRCCLTLCHIFAIGFTFWQLHVMLFSKDVSSTTSSRFLMIKINMFVNNSCWKSNEHFDFSPNNFSKVPPVETFDVVAVIDIPFPAGSCFLSKHRPTQPTNPESKILIPSERFSQKCHNLTGIDILQLKDFSSKTKENSVEFLVYFYPKMDKEKTWWGQNRAI